MKPTMPYLLVAMTLLGLALVYEQPVTASLDSEPGNVSPELAIASLVRTQKQPRPSQESGRDPFAEPPSIPVAQPEAPAAPVSPIAAPASFGSFRVVGKQQDDEGWSVYLAAPGNLGQVWVVREGETFDENYRVSKLAPPLLIVRHTKSGRSKTFDIGKDEE